MESKQIKRLSIIYLTTGHEVTDHRIYDKEALSLSELGATVTIIGKHSYNVSNSKITIVRLASPKNRIQRFFIQAWRTLKPIRKIKADIIHFHDAEILQIVPLLRILKPRAKLIYDVHEDFANIIKLRTYLPKPIKPFFSKSINFFEKSAAFFVHGIVGVTHPLTDKFFNNKKLTLYNFPSKKFYLTAKNSRVSASERKYDLVHFGTLSAERAKFLVEILNILHKENKSFKSLIVGMHPSIFDFLSKIIPEGCDIIGLVPYSEVISNLCNAKIGLDIHPFPTENLKVAVPVKVFEYMACECGVVTSRLPVLDKLLLEADINSDDLPIVSGGIPLDYANAINCLIKRIMANENIGLRLQKKASSYFIWEKEAEKLSSFYLELIQ